MVERGCGMRSARLLCYRDVDSPLAGAASGQFRNRFAINQSNYTLIHNGYRIKQRSR